MKHLLLAGFIAVCLATPALAQSPPLAVRLLAINDFHGNLLPPPGGLSVPDPADSNKRINLRAGGAEHMATLVRQLRDGHANTAFVAAGDLIGASPFLSALFHDEPTVEALSMMDLEIAAVGNHEFDEGKTELLRMQNGGCHPVDGCQGPAPFTGAKYRYLAASTFDLATGKTILPPYVIKEFEGIPVAFIGLTLKGTPNVVSPVGVAGLEFRDEADTVNALVPELKARGVEAIVVLIHEGGYPPKDGAPCPVSGAIVGIVERLDKAIDLIVSGHTHQAYTCIIDGRLVTSGDKYGTMVTAIDLQIDRTTRDIVSAKADNVIVRSDSIAADPAQSALIASYNAVAAPIANRPTGAIAATLSRVPNAAGESPLGDVIADAQLSATRGADAGGAVIAVTNPGGIRTDLAMKQDGRVSFADVFASQPFRNQLVTLTLTGAQITTMLEQQWGAPDRPRILQISNGLTYAWDGSVTGTGSRIHADSVVLNGHAIDPAASYRVTVNSFLAVGGDGFTVLTEGKDRRVGVYDVDALANYIKTSSPVMPGPVDRIRRIN